MARLIVSGGILSGTHLIKQDSNGWKANKTLFN